MKDQMELSYGQLALAYLYPLLVCLICRYRGIRKERDILLSTLRMTLQLFMAALFLTLAFRYPSPWVSLLILAVMEGYVILSSFRQLPEKAPEGLRQAIVAAVLLSTLSCLFYYLLVIVRVTPWYDPQYVIPLAGMFAGGVLTTMGLAIQSLLGYVENQREWIEGALMLGARPDKAMKASIDKTFDMAILPTINKMEAMGIVVMPGMMTGQILAGASPFNAIKYQMAVIFGLLAANAIGLILFMVLASRSFFNEDNQLIEIGEGEKHK